MKVPRFFLCLTFILILASCGKNENKTVKSDTLKSGDSSNVEKSSYPDEVHTRKEKYSLKDFLGSDESLELYTNEIFSSLSDRERASQMIVSSSGPNGKPIEHVKSLTKSKSIGGVIIMGGTMGGIPDLIQGLDMIIANNNSLPLLISMDAEPSLLNSRLKGIDKISATSKLNAKTNIQTAIKISEILTGLGINQNYAPVCDSPENNEIISNRSYGGGEKNIKVLSGQFIKVMQENNIIATAKHFPGHGKVTGDSHVGLVHISGEPEEIDVFKDAIAGGVISVMVGHIAIDNSNKYNTNGLPSSMSRKIVIGLLKEELGFRGIVVTDAMNMGAVLNFETPSLQAVKAGCDMILMPTDEIKLLNSILDEMQKDEQFKEQIYQSCKKIIRAKICLGLIN